MATFPDVYYIKNVETGHYLSITTATSQQPLSVSPTKLDKKSQWRIVSVGDGKYKFKNEEYPLQLHRPTTTIVAQGAEDGYPCYISGPETGRRIHTKPTTREGTVFQQQNIKGAEQVVSAKNSSKEKNQEWVFETAKAGEPGPGPGPEPTDPGPNPGSTDCPIKPGKYRIKNCKTGTVVDLEKMTPGDNVKIFGYGANGNDNQLWDVQPSGTIPSMTLLCVATKKYATYQSLKPGTEFRSASKAQPFFIIPADKDCFYMGPADQPGYVCTLLGANPADETAISLLRNEGLDHQKWQFISS